MNSTATQRMELLERLEQLGEIDPLCSICREHFYSAPDPTRVFAPRHKANDACASGKHPHCTCDGCF